MTKKRDWRIAGITMALLLVVVSFLLVSHGRTTAGEAAASAPDVEVASVEQRDIPVYREWVGTLDGLVNVAIRSQVTGYLLTQNYSERSFVKKGQLLFEIDPRAIQAAVDQTQGQLAQANGQLAQAQAQYQQSEAQPARAEANQRKAQFDENRHTPLAKQHAVTQQDLDNAVQNTISAKAQVKVATAQVEASKAQIRASAAVEAAKAALEAANVNLGFTKLYSPIDGIAGNAQIQIGNPVSPATSAVTTVSTLDPIKVTFAVSEQEYLRLTEERKPGDQVPPFEMILADGTVHPHSGQFAFTGRQVNQSAGAIEGTRAVSRLSPRTTPRRFCPSRNQRGFVRGSALRALPGPQGPAQCASIHESTPIRSRPMHSDLNDIIPISSSALPRQVPNSTLISSNPGLRLVWRAVQMVARTDSSVLIQGETGTGKELVARAVHDESPRKHGPYVKLNCAALPAGLAESELFGHERGAFTGAVSRTDGRFQQAHGGTLFLDEIGELPLELQPKLLRILQEQEYERLGGGRTVRVDVRLIAATNEDLQQMVLQRSFRADLFYRLNVFPISIPPLRQRREDIPLLVGHFLRTLAPRVNREVTEIAEEALDLLKRQEWPGNVRELQNVIERAVIRSSGPRLEIPIEELSASSCPNAVMTQTLAEAERSHILCVLEQTNGVISGRNGAASRLGLPRTTLMYRMQRLGIVQRRTVLGGRGAAQRAIQGTQRRDRDGFAIRASPC